MTTGKPLLLDGRGRRFVLYYTSAQLRLKYRYTALGVLWNFLEPALFLIVLSLIFSVVNNMDITDYAVFLFAALVPWRYFEKVVSSCTDSIVGGDWLLKKMPVSPAALPSARWLIASVEFLFSLIVVFLLFSMLKSTWTIHLLILPLAIIPWGIFGLGLGMISSVLFTFFRDVRPVVQILLMLTFFSSPILFRPDIFPEQSVQSVIVRFHPITYFSALFQKPIYFSRWPDPMDWAVSVVLSVLALAAGLLIIRRYGGRLYYYL